MHQPADEPAGAHSSAGTRRPQPGLRRRLSRRHPRAPSSTADEGVLGGVPPRRRRLPARDREHASARKARRLLVVCSRRSWRRAGPTAGHNHAPTTNTPQQKPLAPLPPRTRTLPIMAMASLAASSATGNRGNDYSVRVQRVLAGHASADAAAALGDLDQSLGDAVRLFRQKEISAAVLTQRVVQCRRSLGVVNAACSQVARVVSKGCARVALSVAARQRSALCAAACACLPTAWPRPSHKRAREHMHTYAHAHAHTHTHTHTHTRRHAHTHTHRHTHAHPPARPPRADGVCAAARRTVHAPARALLCTRTPCNVVCTTHARSHAPRP